MQKLLGTALLAAGIVLLVFGISAADSVQSDVSNFFTGNPTDKAMWLIGGGAVSGVLGLIALLLPARKR